MTQFKLPVKVPYMGSSYACATLFFHIPAQSLKTRYEYLAEPANGYLVRMGYDYLLTDAQATETADWVHQLDLAVDMSADGGVALSFFFVDKDWAMGLAIDGRAGAIAAFTPEDAKALDQLPFKLLSLERELVSNFPETLSTEQLDKLFGALVCDAITAEDAITEILEELGCAPDWPRWSWYETISEQLFLDPDLSDRVIPL